MKIKFLIFFLIVLIKTSSGAANLTLRDKGILGKAAHIIEAVLGADHKVVKKIKELKRKNQIYSTDGGSSYIWGAGIFVKKSKFDLVPVQGNSNNQNLWDFLGTLLHEGIHAAYDVLDPEAGQITFRLLKKFIPKANKSKKQPYPALYHRSCLEKKQIADFVIGKIRDYTIHNMDHVSIALFQTSLEEKIQNSYKQLRRKLVQVRANPLLLKMTYKKVARDWAKISAFLSSKMGVKFNCVDLSYFLLKQKVSYEAKLPKNPVKCKSKKKP